MATAAEIVVGLSIQCDYDRSLDVQFGNDEMIGLREDYPISQEDELILQEHGWFTKEGFWRRYT